MMMWRRALDMLLGRRPVMMQVGAVCHDAATGQVLLITSRDTGRWVIPKGWPMEGRTLYGAAAQEAWEEAGVRGRIHPAELGRFLYEKRQDQGYAVPVEMRVFLLSVDRLDDDFPESRQRQRRWFTPADAARRVVEPGLKRILLSLQTADSPQAAPPP
ncbi:MAG: NUDIX hydrolase [Paracoccus sp.]|uniref:NUDIX hydrolase n=1 Tax=Paracoccus hibiscisoli TaxID=2023261 RepID=UPI00391CB66A|nr:NUDIX hydrolase [Paracoccus sp. (in: a-proteobacteria)]